MSWGANHYNLCSSLLRFIGKSERRDRLMGRNKKGRDGKRKGGKKFHISMLRTIKVEGKNLLSRHNDEGNEKGRET